MALGELQDKASPLFERVWDGVNVVGPGEGVAAEHVADGVVWRDREGEAAAAAVVGVGAGERGGEAAARAGRGVGRVEVEVDVAVEVVDVDAAEAVELRDFEVGVRAEKILKGLIEGVKQ